MIEAPAVAYTKIASPLGRALITLPSPGSASVDGASRAIHLILVSLLVDGFEVTGIKSSLDIAMISAAVVSVGGSMTLWGPQRVSDCNT